MRSPWRLRVWWRLVLYVFWSGLHFLSKNSISFQSRWGEGMWGQMIRFHPQRTGVMDSAFTLILICRHASLRVSRCREGGQRWQLTKSAPSSGQVCRRISSLNPRAWGLASEWPSLAQEAPDALRGPQAWVGQGPRLRAARKEDHLGVSCTVMWLEQDVPFFVIPRITEMTHPPSLEGLCKAHACCQQGPRSVSTSRRPSHTCTATLRSKVGGRPLDWKVWVPSTGPHCLHSQKKGFREPPCS